MQKYSSAPTLRPVFLNVGIPVPELASIEVGTSSSTEPGGRAKLGPVDIDSTLRELKSVHSGEGLTNVKCADATNA